MANNKHTRSRFPRSMVLALFLVSFLGQAVPKAGAAPAATQPKNFFPIVFLDFSTGHRGSISGTVYDAITGDEMQATLCLDGVCKDADSQGNYSFSNVPAGHKVVSASEFLYLAHSKVTLVRNNQNSVVDFVLSPELAQGEYRIVLTWDKTKIPSGPNQGDIIDLDAHLWNPDATVTHVFWGDRGCPGTLKDTACLDRDDQTKNGPETITIYESNPGEKFHFGVVNYSYFSESSPIQLPGTGARVQLYSASGLIGDYAVPATPTSGDPAVHDLWYVFELDGFNEVVTMKDCFTTEPPFPPFTLPACPP